MTAFDLNNPWPPKPPPPTGWELLDDDEDLTLWRWFTGEFNMRRTPVTGAFVIDEPRPSITFDAERLTAINPFADEFTNAEAELERWLLSTLAPLTSGRPVYALSLNHDGYRVSFERCTAPDAATLWPVWLTPNTEYTVFVDPERRMGTFGRPYDDPIVCMFGAPFVDAVRRSPPPGLPKLRESD